ncbi:MAG: RNA polymerase sigma-70 factor [Bacteroidota bacterium]
MTDPKDDLLLFDHVKKGDLKSYEQLFRKYLSDLYRFAFSFLRDEVIAEEIAQEVLLYIWEKRDRIDVQTTFKTYLYSAVKNKCFNYIKTELARQKATEDVNESMLSVTLEDDNTAEVELIKLKVRRAIDALPKKCKHIFILSRDAGLTYEEIAEELELSKKTVENQMGIALKKLREMLESDYRLFKERSA